MTTKKSSSNYLLRNIPEKLWDKAKHRAVDEHLSLRELVLNAVADYLEKEKGGE